MSLKKISIICLIFAGSQHLSLSGAFVLDRILASVNGKIISLSQVEREISFFGKGPLPSGSTFDPEAIEEGTHRLIQHQLLLDEAERFAIEDPAQGKVESQLESIRQRFASEAEFDAALARNAMDRDSLREMIREKLKVNQFIEQRIRFFIIVLPNEISQYYSEHQDQFPNQTLGQAEPEITARIKAQKEKQKYDDLMAKLMSKAKIEINRE